MGWQADICRDTVRTFGSWCEVKFPDEAEPRRVRMVVRDGIRQGAPDSRSGMSRIMPGAQYPDGGRMGYGLLLADDAPEKMSARITGVEVKDSLGRVWWVDQAQGVAEPDSEGQLVIVAWRLVLRCRQDKTGGR